jgi:hypothetical protein
MFTAFVSLHFFSELAKTSIEHEHYWYEIMALGLEYSR